MGAAQADGPNIFVAFGERQTIGQIINQAKSPKPIYRFVGALVFATGIRVADKDTIEERVEHTVDSVME